MAMGWADLASYVGADVADNAYVTQCWNAAVVLVEEYVGSAIVPDEVLERAFLEVGSELFHRRNAPNGVTQFASFDGTAIRVARDPMIGAYSILAKWVVPF